MCQTCVKEGRMTQAELDEANRNQTDSSDGAAMRLFGNNDDAVDFLKSFLGIGTEPDPETLAQEAMDASAKIMLDFIVQEDKAHGVPDNAVDLMNACERDAGKMMYRCRPQTLALSLIVLARRYTTVLEQWATLYARAAIGDDDILDLDSATTAEAKAAVTRVSEHRTGMYL
jgi:hypothetical protein